MTERERAIIRLWHALGLTIECKSKVLPHQWYRVPAAPRPDKDNPEDFFGGRLSCYILRLKPHD